MGRPASGQVFSPGENFGHLDMRPPARTAGLHMRAKKIRKIIATEDVAVIFSDEKVDKFAKDAKLPSGIDLTVFAKGVREAALLFVRDAGVPNGNELGQEIKKLHKAADKRQYDVVAALLESLSPRALEMLKDRGARPAIGTALPSPEALQDPALREGACEIVRRLRESGGLSVEGRRRPSGKRSSSTYRPVLYAPEPRTNFAKREAERTFVMNLSLAWLEATGTAPPRMARHADASRHLGPFARFASECLCFIGRPDADIVD